jgi:dihydroorotase
VRVLLLLALAAPLGAQEIYDLLLKGGHVLDPANRRGERLDVAVIGTRIARVGKDLPASHARIVVNAAQYYVMRG